MGWIHADWEHHMPRQKPACHTTALRSGKQQIKQDLSLLCININKEMCQKNTWLDLEVEELHKFFGLLRYTALILLPSLLDYWREKTRVVCAFSSNCHDKRQIQCFVVEHPHERSSGGPEQGNIKHESSLLLMTFLLPGRLTITQGRS